MATAHHKRKDSVTYDREKQILEFLYEEGPHTLDEIMESEYDLGLRDYLSKALTSLFDQGLVEKDRVVRDGSVLYYWVFAEGAEHI